MSYKPLVRKEVRRVDVWAVKVETEAQFGPKFQGLVLRLCLD